jgi:hypothetical protein
MRLPFAISAAGCTVAIITTAASATGWEMVAPMPAPKANTFAVHYNGAIYMVGGSPWNGGDEDGTVYKFSNGAWSVSHPLTGMGPVVGQGGGVDAQNHIIVFGGLTTPSGDVAESRAYDPVQGPLFTVPDPPITVPPTNFGTAVDGSGRIYRMGGGPGASGFNSGACERYLAPTNSWEQVDYLPFTRASIASTYDGLGHIWGFGGYTSFGMPRLHDTIRYTVATNTWETMGTVPLPNATSNAKAVLGADGRLYIIGGLVGSAAFTPTASVSIIDPSATDFTLVPGPSLNIPRSDFGVALGDDGYIYVIGGYTAPGVATNTVERLNSAVVEVVGDLDNDGDVDAADLAILLGSWGRCAACPADLNGDGGVSASDLAILLGAWTG